MDGLAQWWQDAVADPFYQTFIAEDRYMMILKGLGQTIVITILAVSRIVAMSFCEPRSCS